MDQEKIQKRLIELIEKITGCSATDIQRQSFSFQSDSITGVEMLLAIEERFGIVIEDREVADIQTFDDVINLIRRKRFGP